MKKMSIGSVIIIVFLLGCASSSIVSQLLVPPVKANSNPTRWEYTCAIIPDWYSKNEEKKQTAMAKINEFGSQGWEMTETPDIHSFCFKRPLP